MKKIYSLLLLLIIFNSSIFAQENNRKTSIELYPLPILLGEIGVEAGFALGTNLGMGVQFIYYNPSIGLTNLIIRSQLGKNDELTMKVNAILPALSFAYYSKPEMAGFYVGGLFRFKRASGTVTYSDNSASDPFDNVAKVQATLAINSINPNIITGYRFVFDNNFSLRLGIAMGGQKTLKNEVSYLILEQDSQDDGNDAVNDMRADIPTYTKSFTKSFTFQLMIGLGFTF